MEQTRDAKERIGAAPLSEVVRIGLEDLEKAEASPRYRVDMRVWHRPTQVGDREEVAHCVVCWAGTLIAGTLGGADDEDLAPSDFERPIQLRLEALDMLRRGEFRAAVEKVEVATGLEGAAAGAPAPHAAAEAAGRRVPHHGGLRAGPRSVEGGDAPSRREAGEDGIVANERRGGRRRGRQRASAQRHESRTTKRGPATDADGRDGPGPQYPGHARRYPRSRGWDAR